MEERTYQTRCGTIHYWVSVSNPDTITLVFLPGLTADHRLFDKQIQYFESRYNVIVWDAPAHIFCPEAWYTLHIDAPEGGTEMETEKVYAMPFAKIYPMLVDEVANTDALFDSSIHAALRSDMVNKGDSVVITAGAPVGVSNTTNMMKVERI